MLSLSNKLDREKLTFLDLTFSLANLIEHFDSSLYYFLASKLAINFFPSQDLSIQLVIFYSLTITTIFTKPLGAMIFGAIASTKSPVFALRYSLNGLAVATILTGCLPTFTMFGIASPVLLIIIRIFFGIFAGGERAVVRLYMLEGSSSSSGLKKSYLYDIASILGIILASFTASIIIDCKGSQAWRGCFGIAGCLGLLVSRVRCCYLSQEVLNNQTNFYGNINNCNRLDLIIKHQFKYLSKCIFSYKFVIINISLLSSFSYITYAVPFIFFNNFVPMVANNISISEVLSVNKYLLIFDLISLLIISKLNLVYNLKPEKILLISSSILCITVVPLLSFLLDASIIKVFFISMWIIFWGSAFTGAANCWYKNLLGNIPEQYFLLGFADALGSTLLGKTSISCCFYLWYISRNIFFPSIYIVILMFCTVIVLLISIKQMFK
jgi:MFS family permease